MSINKLKAEKILKFGEVEYKAKMSLDTIIRIENLLNCSILKLGNKLAQGDITLTEIISIITLAIRGGGNDIKDNDIKGHVSEIGLIESIKMAGELVTLALNVDDDSEKKSESE
mgnify:CR=1 FL=1|jgi:hypothetical protein|tara:strand:- start:237 stop:578 length:342 start_codon:yes stop_codon:yes gene_type:complete